MARFRTGTTSIVIRMSWKDDIHRERAIAEVLGDNMHLLETLRREAQTGPQFFAEAAELVESLALRIAELSSDDPAGG